MFKAVNNGRYLEQELGEPNVVAPFSVIQNRAKVNANLKLVPPCQRYPIYSLRKLINEYGPEGQFVYTSDKEDTQLRVFGSNWRVASTGDGNSIGSSGTGGAWDIASDQFEVTFYGTGLNIVTGTLGNTIVLNRWIDGVADTIDVVGNINTFLSGRGYRPNQIINVAKDLTEGWHTVRLGGRSGNTGGFSLHAYEVLNTASEIKVLEGSIFKNGYEHILQAAQSLPMIPASYVGTKGGRCLVYIDPADGIVKQAVQQHSENRLYLEAADHSQEAAYRRVHVKEFGRFRADDLSTIDATVTSRAFTLDDGVTTLIVDSCNFDEASEDALLLNDASSWISITFEGTGLDVLMYDQAGAYTYGGIEIDGEDTGVNFARLGNVNSPGYYRRKVVSGLPQGTHTVRFRNNVGAASAIIMKEFIIYKPKKPAIDKEAVVLTDYCIQADFATNALTFGDRAIHQGVRRTQNIREILFEGAWNVGGGGAVSTPTNSGFLLGTNAASQGNIRTHKVCTGFSIRYDSVVNGPTALLITLNGLPLTAANFPTAVVTLDTNGGSYNSSTGEFNIVFSSGSASNNGITVTGLPLDNYEIIADNQNTGVFQLHSVDFIQPTTAPNLSIGGNYAPDLRIDRRPNIGEAKALAHFDRDTADIEYTENILQIGFFGTSGAAIWYEEPFTQDDCSHLIGGTTGNQECLNGRPIAQSPFRLTFTRFFASSFYGFNPHTGAESPRPFNSVAFYGNLQREIYKD